MTHVDDWVATPNTNASDAYAKFFFLLARLPAWMQFAFEPWTRQFKLFCTWKGEQYRVTGASRMGDVWLAKDMNRETGYDHRVDLAECTNWRSEL